MLPAQPDLKEEISELLKIGYALDGEEEAAHASSSSSSTRSKERDSIKLKDLKRLLAEYERETGRTLLNEEARPVLDNYIQASPETVLEADSLQQMISMLNDSRREVDEENASEGSASIESENMGDDSIGVEDDHTLMSSTLTTLNDAIAVRARLEAVQRQLSEKERQHSSAQHEHEMFIAQLQEELDEANALLSVKRREEKDHRQRENKHLDSIASLETAVNQAEMALQLARDQMANYKADYEEQLNETDRLRAQLNEVQEEVERLKVEDRSHAEMAKMWEGDRDAYREKIAQLHDLIEQVEAEAARAHQSERDNTLLREQIERVIAEAEDLRRGSSLMGSLRGKSSDVDPGTLSKRLGSELARHFASVEEEEESDEGEKTGGGDESIENTYLIERRRARKSRIGKEAQQTSSEPPSYDEAAHEQEISKRLHPQQALPSELPVKDKGYQNVVLMTGMRCTLLEASLAKTDSLTDSTTTVKAEEAADTTATEKGSFIQQYSIKILRGRDYCGQLAFSLFSQLPLSQPLKAELKSVEQDESGRQAIAIIALCSLLLIFGFGLAILWLTLASTSGRIGNTPFVEEDWLFRHSRHDTPWSPYGGLKLRSYEQPGLLDWLWPESDIYRHSPRIPT